GGGGGGWAGVRGEGRVMGIVGGGERGGGRKGKSGIKEESVVIDYHDLEVPSPKVTIMKFVTMQGDRFREPDSVTVDHHILVLIIRDVSVSVSRQIPFAIDRARISRRDRFVEPLPVLQPRIHIRSR